jgi:hypothetical protein
MKGLVPRVVVAKYEDNTPRTKKVMIQAATASATASATATATPPRL